MDDPHDASERGLRGHGRYSQRPRLLWPLADTRLERRLHRIRCPTLIVWGAEDKVLSPSYAQRFAAGIAGKTSVKLIPGAGHLADLDAPAAVAEAVLDALG